MSTTPSAKFVPTTVLARFAGVDPRTAARRLAAAGRNPDARMQESTGETLLWCADRIRDLVNEIQSRGMRDDLQAALPTAAALLGVSPAGNAVFGRSPFSRAQ